jgi:hypothetical protein
MEYHNKPMAAYGLISYRIKGRYGFIMIGARDHNDAWNQALRSSKYLERKNLEIWNGKEYELTN